MRHFQDGLDAFQAGEFERAREIFMELAEGGDGRAFSFLGSLFSSGEGGAQDKLAAVEWYEKAADLGEAEAAYNLGAIFALGEGVPQDYSRALECYRRAADLGDLDGLCKAGVMVALGQGVDRDLNEAERVWESAAAREHGASMLLLGNLYNGAGTQVSAARACHWYLQAAMEGEEEAVEAILALRTKLQEAAEEGTAEAQFVLGSVLEVVEKDTTQAARWFSLASEKGHPGAQRSLGYLLQKGDGVPRDRQKAHELYTAAAAGGDKFAQYNLGAIYSRGMGVPVDADQAIAYYTRAAEQGFSPAYVLLGNELALLDRDSEAAVWFLRAASDGHVGAVQHIASWYRDGIGVERDLVQAARWYFALLGQGNADGIHEIHGFVGEMTEQQIRQAAREAGDESLAAAALSAWR